MDKKYKLKYVTSYYDKEYKHHFQSNCMSLKKATRQLKKMAKNTKRYANVSMIVTHLYKSK